MKNRILVAILPVLTCFALLPGAQAQCLDGCDSTNFNTFQGDGALINNTIGAGNAAFGWRALFANTFGSFNTGLGGGALVLNNGNDNTAAGAAALLLNTTGNDNTAVGTDAMVFNDSGNDDVAVGSFALFNNVSGADNTAVGFEAMEFNVLAFTNAALGTFAMQNNDSSGNGTGVFNTAVGGFALQANVDGTRNTAVGAGAMENAPGGDDNTAVGEIALLNIAGSNNVAVGSGAGNGLGTSVNNCIAIGAPGAGPFATLNSTCFIGSIFGQPVSDPGTQTAVFVDQFNVVGIMSSSRRFKHDITPMDKTSETLYRLKPVTFKFNSDWKATTQYGLIAEEVAEVNPGLVVRGGDGEVQTVRYEQINTMLLNEFLKEHRKVEQQEASITELKSTTAKQEALIAKQQKEMETVVARLKEQASQIQKVSAQLELNKRAPRTVANK